MVARVTLIFMAHTFAGNQCWNPGQLSSARENEIDSAILPKRLAVAIGNGISKLHRGIAHLTRGVLSSVLFVTLAELVGISDK